MIVSNLLVVNGLCLAAEENISFLLYRSTAFTSYISLMQQIQIYFKIGKKSSDIVRIGKCWVLYG